MSQPKLSDALKRIAEDILDWTPEELQAHLDSRELGDVGQFFLDMLEITPTPEGSEK